MEPQPSTSAAAAKEVASTSGFPPAPEQQLETEEQLASYLEASIKQCQQLCAATWRVNLQRCQVPDAPLPVVNVNTPALESNISVTNATSSSSETSEDSSHVSVSEVKEEEDSSYCEEVEVPSAPSGSADVRGACKLVEYSDSESDSSEDDIKVFTASRAAPSSRQQPVPTPSMEITTSASTQSAEEAPDDSSSRSVAASLRKVKWEDSSDPESSPSVSSEDELQSTAASLTAPSTKKRPVATVGAKSGAAPRTRPAAGKRDGLRMAIKLEDDSDSTTGNGSEDEEDVKAVRVPPTAPSTKKIGKGIAERNGAVCKKALSSKSYLKVDMAKHTGKNRYKCEKCGRSFWCQNSLSKHQKKRDHQNGVGLKSFICGECGKGFAQNSDLSQHSRIHSGVWQFTCVFCEKGFHFKKNLFQHLLVHTGEKPLFCGVEGCGASFRDYSGLIYHRRARHS